MNYLCKIIDEKNRKENFLPLDIVSKNYNIKFKSRNDIKIVEDAISFDTKILYRMFNILSHFYNDVCKTAVATLNYVYDTVTFEHTFDRNTKVDSFISASIDYGMAFIEKKFNSNVYLNADSYDNFWDIIIKTDQEQLFDDRSLNDFKKEFSNCKKIQMNIPKPDGITYKLKSVKSRTTILVIMSNFNYKRIERLNEISNIHRNHLYDACIDYTLKLIETNYNSGKVFGNPTLCKLV